MEEILSLHQQLINILKQEGDISSLSVESAMRQVPRHLFLPDAKPEDAYKDKPIPIYRSDTNNKNDENNESSASQPSLIARMLEMLDLKPGHRVLEIGAGTGYNAALMASIVGDTGQVVTVDISEYMVEQAGRNLKAAGFDRVKVIGADGGFGYSELAPFDRIIASVGTWDIPSSWYEQLHSDGRILLPLSIRGQQILASFEPKNGSLQSNLIKECMFMRIKGSYAEPRVKVCGDLGKDMELCSYICQSNLPDRETLQSIIENFREKFSSKIQAKMSEFVDGLFLWTAVNDPSFSSMWYGSTKRGWSGFWFPGLVENGRMCFLEQPYLELEDGSSLQNDTCLEIFVYSFGDDDTLSDRLLDHLHAWDAADRPDFNNLQIKAYPIKTEYAPSKGETVIKAESSKFVLRLV
jgi:protein-L-isoaspartate(D-aspartate) O-methyltransferase